MSKKIIWIASYPKSGNTWLRAIISALLYTSKGEFNFNLLKLIEQFDKVQNYEFIKDTNLHDLKIINKHIENISKFWIQAQKNIVFNNKLNPLYNIFKTHSANVILNENQFTTPKLTYGCIYIVRDPRDIAFSFASHRGKTINDTIDFMSKTESYLLPSKNHVLTLLTSWDLHYKSWMLLKVPILLIKYEALLEHTEIEIKKIIKFMNQLLNIDEQDLNDKIYNICKSTDIKKFIDYEKKFGFDEASKNRSFFRKNDSNWKKNLSINQINRIENLFKSTMQKLNYI